MSIVGVLVLSCGGGGGNGTSGPAETGTSTTGTSTAGTTFGEPDACTQTEECMDLFCVAPWDPGLDQRGAAACVPDCVGVDDLALFCIDDAACCEGLRCNEVDGLCSEIESTGDDTGSSGSGTGDSSSGTDMSSSGTSESSSATGATDGSGTSGSSSSG